jgi:hypothetical protein
MTTQDADQERRPPEQPRYSPDGRWFFDGYDWRPVPAAVTRANRRYLARRWTLIGATGIALATLLLAFWLRVLAQL